MTSDRKKPGVAFWATVVVVVVLVAYPLSFGPACWISSRMNGGNSKIVSFVYGPVIPACRCCPKFVVKFARWYSEIGAAQFWKWHVGHWRMIDGTESTIDIDE
jgi:asparagine N-glycosylation enzyme membrane subunit Stt3